MTPGPLELGIVLLIALLVFGIVGILYFLLCWPLSLYGSHLERRMAIAAR